jgi:glyoxalase family protein
MPRRSPAAADDTRPTIVKPGSLIRRDRGEPVRVARMGPGEVGKAGGLFDLSPARRTASVQSLDVLPEGLHPGGKRPGKPVPSTDGTQPPRQINDPGYARSMRFEGIHHVTCITGDAPGNVRFYTGVIGLRLVKKTVNQDDPTVYHVFYADEAGSPGADLTFFEYPGARRGRAGDGMVHTITFRLGSEAALDYWEARLADAGHAPRRSSSTLAFTDPEGLRLELAHVEVADAPLVARHPEIPPEHAIQGFHGIRAFAAQPVQSVALLEQTMGFVALEPGTWELRGTSRGGLYGYDPPPVDPGIPGAGTVHHVAWSSTMEDHEAWQRAIAATGLRPTPPIDRFWFRSIYFREPSGVLFELATTGPGFGVDEDPEHLGERLILPPTFEHLREKVEKVLTPLPDPRAGWAA